MNAWRCGQQVSGGVFSESRIPRRRTCARLGVQNHDRGLPGRGDHARTPERVALGFDWGAPEAKILARRSDYELAVFWTGISRIPRSGEEGAEWSRALWAAPVHWKARILGRLDILDERPASGWVPAGPRNCTPPARLFRRAQSFLMFPRGRRLQAQTRVCIEGLSAG